MGISHYQMGIEGTVNDVIYVGIMNQNQLESKDTIINAKYQINTPFITTFYNLFRFHIYIFKKRGSHRAPSYIIYNV